MRQTIFFLRSACFILSVFILLFVGSEIVLGATSVITGTTQTITSGFLSISVPYALSMSSINVSTSSQNSTGTISVVNVYDQRGTAVGWTTTLDMQHLTVTKNPIASSGNSSPAITLSSGNRYNGTCGEISPHAIYTVQITLGGSVGTAKYSVTGGCTGESNQTDVVTASTDNSVGSRGVKADFPSGTYVLNDNWKIPVDVYSYTNMNVTPQAPTAGHPNSNLTGVTQGSSGNLSGSGTSSNPKTILTASSGNGMGSYNQEVTLQLTVHPTQYAGIYNSTLTITVS